MRRARKKLKILLGSDYPIMVWGVRCLLAEHFNTITTDVANSVAELLEKLGSRGTDWDVVFMNFTSGRGTVDAVKEVRSLCPELPMLVLNSHFDDYYGIRVLRAGAQAYLSKESTLAELQEALRKLTARKTWVAPALLEKLVSYIRGGLSDILHLRLTDREYEILRWIALGKSISEIATEVSLSPKTVQTYRARVMEKLNMKNDVQLTRYALGEGLVD
jgi:DNA-binding NarL/FixJ family response regulator